MHEHRRVDHGALDTEAIPKLRLEGSLDVVAAAMVPRRCILKHMTAATCENTTSPCSMLWHLAGNIRNKKTTWIAKPLEHCYVCECASVCEPKRDTQTPTWAAWDPGQRSKGWHPWTQTGSSRTCLGDPGPGPGAPNPITEAGPELIVCFSFCLWEVAGQQPPRSSDTYCTECACNSKATQSDLLPYM